MRVGFIGLGLMGNPMAKNILKAGFPLTVYNRSEAKLADFTHMCVAVAPTPRELALRSDVVITMVTSPRDVEDVLFGQHGVCTSGAKNLTVIDMSTIGPSTTKRIAAKLEESGMQFLDAPVTGGTYGAKSGELTIFVGGKKDVFVKMKNILESMGNNIHYMGGVGSGQAIKMINNYLIASSLVALSEGMLLADQMGLSRKALADALITTPAVSLAMTRKIQNYVENSFEMNFTIKNMQKDLSLALSESADSHLKMLQMVQALYTKANESGLAQMDYSQIIDAIKSEE